MGEHLTIKKFILAQEWWAILLEGILALIFGFLILGWPVLTLEVFVLFFSLFALVDGLFALVALTQAEKGRRGLLVLQGVCGIAIGFIAFLWPKITLAVLLVLVMVWLLVSGIFRLVGALKLPAGDSSKWVLGLNGILSIAIGLILISLPGLEGLILTAYLIAFFAIFAGITLVVLALMVRSKKGQMTT
jgi:uncharacterized membrane protein HdeD (DUF308 family)